MGNLALRTQSMTLWPRDRMQLLKARLNCASELAACCAPRPMPPTAAPSAAPRPGAPKIAPTAAPPAAPTAPPTSAPRAASVPAEPDDWRASARHSSMSRLVYWARELPKVSTVGDQLSCAHPAAASSGQARIAASLRMRAHLLDRGPATIT